MMRALCICSVLGLAASNFVSPGLGKCLDLQAELKEDGKRESLKEMQAKTEPIEVQLYSCHGKANQHYLVADGKIKSYSMQDRCLTASKRENNANVDLQACDDGNPNQQWELTGDGYVRVPGTNKCLDVKAEKKEDGTYESWSEIKKHKTNNVHLYECHDPKTTERINQLWMWAPYKDGKMVSEMTEDWAVQALSLEGTGSSTLAMTVAGAIGLFAVGAFVGTRVRRTPSLPLSTQAIE